MTRDLTGQIFGRLTVQYRQGSSNNGNSLWKCSCKCGTTVVVRRDGLTTGNTQSCGCLRRERLGAVSRKNLLGQRFGRLVVIAESGRTRNNNSVRWLCQCDCGSQTVVCSNDLRSRSTRSCGCLNRELASQRARSNIQMLKFKYGISKSGKLFLDAVENLFAINIEREYELDSFLFDGRFGRVLIEVDSDFWHGTKSAQRRDAIKDNIALRHGYAIVRLIVNRVSDIEHVLLSVRYSLEKVFELSHRRPAI